MYPENEIESGKLEFQAEPRKVDLPPNPGRRRYVIARKSRRRLVALPWSVNKIPSSQKCLS